MDNEPPSLVEEEEGGEVEGILRHKDNGAHHHYQMLSKDYSFTKATWEPKYHLINAPHILQHSLHQMIATAKPR